MLPETSLDGFGNINNSALPRTRASVCLSPVTGTAIVGNKRKSWCGSSANQNHSASRRYGELGHFTPGSDAFLEPYFRGLDHKSSQIEPLSPANPISTSSLSSRCPSGESLHSYGGSDGGSEYSESGYGTTCDISLRERLIRSHPIWFLPGIQRAGAFHLLQGNEEGCFIVRQSSQASTMALSVRLPEGKGPYIEHYLIKIFESRLGLETSANRFDNMPELIAHYTDCCDELPVQLVLPKSIRESKTRQQLSSLGLLGHEFWRYTPSPSTVSNPDTSCVADLSPTMSTFKITETLPHINTIAEKPTRPNTLKLIGIVEPNTKRLHENNAMKTELLSRTPPTPPPRWSKPSTPQNNFTVTTTVTFSVNSPNPSYDQSTEPLTEVEVFSEPKRISPEGQCSSSFSLNGSLRRGSDQLSSRKESLISPNSERGTLSPDPLSSLPLTKTTRRSKRNIHKASKHYQESDIIDSPTMLYYKSGLIDKISDYEDVWTNEIMEKTPKNLDLASPDLLKHTANIDFINDKMSSKGSFNKSNCCHTPKENQYNLDSFVTIPVVKDNNFEIFNISKEGSNFYSEPADAIATTSISKSDKEYRTIQQDLLNRSDLFRFISPEFKEIRTANLNASDCDVNNMESSDPEYDCDGPLSTNLKLLISPSNNSISNNRTTILDMITIRFPDIKASTGLSTAAGFCRMSAYDNVEVKRLQQVPPSETSELTEFSDPWNEGDVSKSKPLRDEPFCRNNPSTPPRTIKERYNPLLCGPRLNKLNSEKIGLMAVGASIRTYALELAKDKNTTFAQNIDNFIACTSESKETNPKIVMRNIRQFMSGMKNYLIKHGEKELYKEIELERRKLKSTEFLNLDAILEGVMHTLVVNPLNNHLQTLFLDHYTKTGAIRLLADNIQFVSARPVSELALKTEINLPSAGALGAISQYFHTLQTADSPLHKFEFLLAAIAIIFDSVKTDRLTRSGKSVKLGADDFLSLFIWVLVKTNFVAAEIEADYMWGLLHPSLLSGEGGYYLTSLSSAIHELKQFKDSCDENIKNNVKNYSVFKVVVPDELHGSISTKTIPAKPHMTTKDVCNIIAHKSHITNPQDYALYRVTDGEETMLMDNECPQKFIIGSRHTMLAYKRTDAKIAWPNPYQTTN